MPEDSEQDDIGGEGEVVERRAVRSLKLRLQARQDTVWWAQRSAILSVAKRNVDRQEGRLIASPRLDLDDATRPRALSSHITCWRLNLPLAYKH